MLEGSKLKLCTEIWGQNLLPKYTRAFFHNLSALQTSWQIVCGKKESISIAPIMTKFSFKLASEGELQTKAQT